MFSSDSVILLPASAAMAGSRHLLRKGELMRLRRARGRTITCESGSLWITEEGIPGDVILGMGESHQFTTRGLVVIEGFRPSTAEITAK